MKQIFQGLIAMQLQTNYKEIFEFRETHIGNPFFSVLNRHFSYKIYFILICSIIGTASQAIKALAYAIEKRRHRKERQYGKNSNQVKMLTSHSTSIVLQTNHL